MSRLAETWLATIWGAARGGARPGAARRCARCTIAHFAALAAPATEPRYRLSSATYLDGIARPDRAREAAIRETGKVDAGQAGRIDLDDAGCHRPEGAAVVDGRLHDEDLAGLRFDALRTEYRGVERLDAPLADDHLDGVAVAAVA